MESYTDPKFPGAFTGKAAFSRAIGKPLSDVTKFLEGNDAYTLHKPTRKPRRFRRIYSRGIGYHFQADLVDMSSDAAVNDGYKWIITVIDTFSKRLWVFKMKDKRAKTVYDALKPLIEKHKPQKFETDDGGEFKGKFKKLLADNGVDHYSVSSDRKCAVVERVNRTLRTRMFRAFTVLGKPRWVDILDDLANGYNNSYHRSIKMRPIDVTKENENEVRKNLYPPRPKKRPPKLKVGDSVRISRLKNPFEKGAEQTWKFEIFYISKVKNTNPVTYNVKDFNGEVLKGSFYEEEVQKVSPSGVYKVDKIIKKRTVKGKLQYLVKWKGYSDAANSWVKHRDLFTL